MNNVNNLKTRITKIEKQIEEQLQAERAEGVLAIVSFPCDMPEEERKAIIEAKEKEMEEAGCSGPLIEIADRKFYTTEDLENGWGLKHES